MFFALLGSALKKYTCKTLVKLFPESDHRDHIVLYSYFPIEKFKLCPQRGNKTFIGTHFFQPKKKEFLNPLRLHNIIKTVECYLLSHVGVKLVIGNAISQNYSLPTFYHCLKYLGIFSKKLLIYF